MLSEHDITNKKFHIKLKGYDKIAVNKVLKHVCHLYDSCSSKKTFKQLKNHLADVGFNTQFLGYDGQEVTHFIDSIKKDLANPKIINKLCAQNKSQQPNLLTPKQIQKTTFNIKNRGYSINQVNSFLDRMNKSYRTLLKENKQLKTKLNNRR